MKNCKCLVSSIRAQSYPTFPHQCSCTNGACAACPVGGESQRLPQSKGTLVLEIWVGQGPKLFTPLLKLFALRIIESHAKYFKNQSWNRLSDILITCESISIRYKKTTSSLSTLIALCKGNSVLDLIILYNSCALMLLKSSFLKSSWNYREE